MIYYSSPYDLQKNLGREYNDFFSLIPGNSDFGCLTDADTLFTTSEYGHQLDRVIRENPDCRLFYAITNRIHCPWQRATPEDDSDDLAVHRHFGFLRFMQFGTSVVERQHETMPASGFFMLIRKDLWKETPFRENGMLGVDNHFFFAAQSRGERILQIPGLYLYHWYKGDSPNHPSQWKYRDRAHLLPSARAPANFDRSRGVLYLLAGGDDSQRKLLLTNLNMLRRSGYDGPVLLITTARQRLDCDEIVVPAVRRERYIAKQNGKDRDFSSRWYKTRLYDYSPFDTTLFLDIDAFPLRSIEPIWSAVGPDEIAAARDVFAPSVKDVFPERRPWKDPGIQLDLELSRRICFHAEQSNTGVMVWTRGKAVHDLFETWHEQWKLTGRFDQLAFARACKLQRTTPKRLPPEFNDMSREMSLEACEKRGSVIAHFNGCGAKAMALRCIERGQLA